MQVADETGAASIKLWAPYCEHKALAYAEPGITKLELRNVYCSKTGNQMTNSDYG